ncbi:MAG: chromate transporter [Chloroflexota bacterium]|nr:chromate transporter [Chloroflexota bacterium]
MGSESSAATGLTGQDSLLGATPPRAPGLIAVAAAFARVGFLSFGGGSASLLLMRRELVDRRRWITNEQFNRGWTLSKLSPGTNQIAQVILYGRHLAGWGGAALAIAGFLLPAVGITILLSALLLAAIGNQLTQDALRLVIPATGGMTMAVAVQMWGPKIRPAVSATWRRLAFEAVVVLCSALLVGLVHLPVPLVMLAAIVGGAIRGR